MGGTGRRAVVRISFGGGNFDTPDFVRKDVEDQLGETERLAGLELDPVEASIRFRRLRCTSAPGGGRSFWWTNKPILDALRDRELAMANRNFLRGFYAMIKDCDEQLRFVFLTGVSKFSQAGLFSGLNNLLEPEFSTICGYTDAELDAVFAPELEGLDREKVRRWYNGYNWRGADKVYNPFDILLLFRTREFEAHWFRTGTQTFWRGAGSRRRPWRVWSLATRCCRPSTAFPSRRFCSRPAT